MTFSIEKKHLSWVETLQKTKFGQKKNLKDTVYEAQSRFAIFGAHKINLNIPNCFNLNF